MPRLRRIPPGPFDPLDGDVQADVCVIGARLYRAVGGSGFGTRRAFGCAVSKPIASVLGHPGEMAGRRARATGFRSVSLVSLLALMMPANSGTWPRTERPCCANGSPITRPRPRYTPGIIHAMWSEAGVQDEHDEADWLAEHYGYDQIEKLDEAALKAHVISPKFKGGVIDRGAGHIHPLRYVFGLVRACYGGGRDASTK